MKNMLQTLQETQYQYESIKHKAEASLQSNHQEGRLRISHSNGSIQYYLCDNTGPKNGKYIKKKNQVLIHALAQKDYDQKVIDNSEEWIAWAKKAQKTMPTQNTLQIYEELNDRKSLVNAYTIPDDEYRKRWEAVEYQGKGFAEDAPEFYSEKDERVRSKSEKMIADKLYMMGIPYRYEYPTKLYMNGRVSYYNEITIYPDFTILRLKDRKEFILEHFGIMDNPDYAKNAVKKIHTYEQNGIYLGDRLLTTYETYDSPINMKNFENMIKNLMVSP